MVKHTQTVRWRLAICLSVFDHFVDLVLKGLYDAQLLSVTVPLFNKRYYKHGCVEIDMRTINHTPDSN